MGMEREVVFTERSNIAAAVAEFLSQHASVNDTPISTVAAIGLTKEELVDAQMAVLHLLGIPARSPLGKVAIVSSAIGVAIGAHLAQGGFLRAPIQPAEEPIGG